jgi:hypothetical protein
MQAWADWSDWLHVFQSIFGRNDPSVLTDKLEINLMQLPGTNLKRALHILN